MIVGPVDKTRWKITDEQTFDSITMNTYPFEMDYTIREFAYEQVEEQQRLLRQRFEKMQWDRLNRKVFDIPIGKSWEIDMRFQRYESSIEPKIDEEQWRGFVGREYTEVVEEIEENGWSAQAWVLVDYTGYVAPWQLINSKNGPCWQNIHDRSLFCDAFFGDKPNKHGLVEKEANVDVMVSKTGKNGSPGVRTLPTTSAYLVRRY